MHSSSHSDWIADAIATGDHAGMSDGHTPLPVRTKNTPPPLFRRARARKQRDPGALQNAAARGS